MEASTKKDGAEEGARSRLDTLQESFTAKKEEARRALQAGDQIAFAELLDEAAKFQSEMLQLLELQSALDKLTVPSAPGKPPAAATSPSLASRTARGPSPPPARMSKADIAAERLDGPILFGSPQVSFRGSGSHSASFGNLSSASAATSAHLRIPTNIVTYGESADKCAVADVRDFCERVQQRLYDVVEDHASNILSRIVYAHCLRGNAASFVKLTYGLAQGGVLPAWQQFRADLIKRFETIPHSMVVSVRLDSLRVGLRYPAASNPPLTVVSYCAEYRRLAGELNVLYDHSYTTRFIKGLGAPTDRLRMNVENSYMQNTDWSLDRLLTMLEFQHASLVLSGSIVAESSASSVRCFNCQELGHRANECKKPA